MSPAEILLVRDSFRQLVPVPDQVAALFYARLFELDPTVRSLFRGDMTDQGRKLVEAIGAAVAGLDRLDTIVPTLRRLGAGHVAYGVTEEHYATVGVALLWAIQRVLGSGFTPEVREAWTSTYSLIANAMIDGAREAARAA